MSKTAPDDFSKAASLIREAAEILVFTGAGLSTSSGIPDYRGPEGLWRSERPILYGEFLASEEARCAYWQQKLTWWEAFKNAEPNDAHYAAVRLERAGKLCALLTQNIDGLHLKAGTTPGKLVELHGTNAKVECQSCRRLFDPEPHFDFFRTHRRCPRCPCGGYLKSATISFGQNLKQEDIARAFHYAESCDCVIALGSTLSVTPACLVPLHAAQAGAPYVIVNRGPTDHDGHRAVAVRLEGDVVELFPRLVREALPAGG